MKEATGELNMTIVTLVAITAVGALLYFVVWPMIQRMIVENTCQTYGSDYHATTNACTNDELANGKCFPAGDVKGGSENGDATVSEWNCKYTASTPTP